MKNLWLADKIISAYRENGFISAVIFGKQGAGKTTYALKTLRDVYATLNNIDKDSAWGYVLQYTFFELPDALNILTKSLEEGKVIPAILFDDASIWLSKYYWYENYMKAFYAYYALIRTNCSAVLFTSPSPEDIAKFLREKGWLQVKIRWKNKKDRIALAELHTKTFALNNRGQFIEKNKKKAVDMFKVELPNDIYAKYMKARKETQMKLLERVKEMLASKTQK